MGVITCVVIIIRRRNIVSAMCGNCEWPKCSFFICRQWTRKDGFCFARRGRIDNGVCWPWIRFGKSVDKAFNGLFYIMIHGEPNLI